MRRKRDALRSELSWTHYRQLMRVSDTNAREFYLEEASKAGWSSRQLQMYVNYYTREMMNEGDNPPVGILLCADKSDTLVEYTLPENDQQIYASKYLPYLPTEEELKRQLRIADFEKVEE